MCNVCAEKRIPMEYYSVLPAMKYYLSAGNTTPPRLPDEPVLSAPLNLSTKACVSPAPHTPGNIYYISTIISIISTMISTVSTMISTVSTLAEPHTEILGGPDIYLEEGFTMNLTCLVRDSPEPPQYIFWYRNEQVSTR